MDFQKRMKQRQYIAIFYIVLGLVLIITGLLRHTDNSFIFAFGVAMLVLGILRTAQYRKITVNEQSMRKRELMETDERNRMISERAKSWVFSLSVFIAGVLVIVLSLLGHHELALPISWFVCGMVVLYWICWIIISKKY